ncbi:MAG: hypothetical protein ACJ797_06965 [Ktedonobacteraceae bacterium]
MNNSAQSWRELLGKLTENPAEKQRVAEALGVNAFTVTRWVTGESEPRLHNLKRLPDVFPPYRALFSELIQADLAPNVAPRTIPPFEGARLEVPSEYLVRTLATYATTSGPFRTWSIRNLNLQQAIELLDPDMVGMEITVVQCVPPVPGQLVRSLCERIGVGSAPWDGGVGRRLLFLGAESLAGWAVGRGQPGVVQDSEQKLGPLPFRPGAYEKSAVAWPFQREGKFAGCLVVVCTRVDYFTPLRLSFIEVYANALALSFRDEEFYLLSQIALHEMPILSVEEQRTYTAQLRDRVLLLRREYGYQLSEAEAERQILQQMEAELLLLHTEARE